jgi:hypothetical protein
MSALGNLSHFGISTSGNVLCFSKTGKGKCYHFRVTHASIKSGIANLDYGMHGRGLAWYFKKFLIKVWLYHMIGDAVRLVHLMGRPVARERDNERCHGFVWGQGGPVIDCVESPELSNSSTSPFVSKQKVMFRNNRRKGQLRRFGVKRRILGLVRLRHFIGQPLPCMKRTTHLYIDAHAR